METSDWNQRLIRGLESSGMEEDGGETGLQRPNTLVQLLRQKETRLKRISQCLAVALLLLFLAAVALLIAAVRGGRGQPLAVTQSAMQVINNSSGTSNQQQHHEDSMNPSAMLTVPRGSNLAGQYLAWESDKGHTICRGGFSYSNGSLVVPRAGIYRVFLQITYESKEDLVCHSKELRLTNMVLLFRETYTNNVPLLSAVDTVSCSMRPWSKSLYTSGLFHLEANCKLHVTSSNPELIVKKEYQVFFGAELLPQ